MSKRFDVVIIGAGPAGYVAAIRAAQLGMSVACIDDWKNPDGSLSYGGTCLNAGCIPSKALLESSELVHRAKHEFATHGIDTGPVKVDLAKMQQRKAGIVKQLTGGIAALFKANKIMALQGRGRLLKERKVEFTPHGGKAEILGGKNIILASGSIPAELRQVPFDGKTIVDSWGGLEFDAVPKRLAVIGGGVIGLELGSVWQRLGAEVVILEALDDFLFMIDRQIARDTQRQFKRQGLDIRLGAKVSGATTNKSGIKLTYADSKGEQSVEVDKVIVCVGRRPNSVDLFEKNCGLKTDASGFVEVDNQCRTGVANVWAIGDLVRGPMLAHKGSEEGVMVADLIAGEISEVNYHTIPSIIYTAPEIAWVGQNEEEVRKSGRTYKVGTFSFAANGRAKAMEMAAGMVKIIAAKDDDEILGVHIAGPMAGELIAEAVLAMEFSASAEDLQRTIHGHPTLSEALHEAALAVDNRAIHALNN